MYEYRFTDWNKWTTLVLDVDIGGAGGMGAGRGEGV